ncbi:NAD-binding protein [Streptomyces sp. MS1.AVA.3]|uniref:NAD-binding protein n=1 Tax=Streptomyces decoyicus TaxID=249567 RepID=UPI0030C57FE9
MERAAALALTYRDDQVNVTAALLARTLNPTIRLVVRMYHRERGQHLERLLDRAVLALGRTGGTSLDMSTTVLSDTDTAVRRPGHTGGTVRRSPGRPGERGQSGDSGGGGHPTAARHRHLLPPAVHPRPADAGRGHPPPRARATAA